MSLSHKECNAIIKKNNNNNCFKGYSKLNIKEKNEFVKKKAPKQYKRAKLIKGSKI